MAAKDTVKILIVDDLPDKLLVYRSILEEEGQEVVTANSGAEALKKILTDEFAVILLDVNMPGMDGFETAELIRRRKRSAHTPIIFATSNTDELHALRGYSYGAVDYILTPVMPEILRTKIRVFVQLFRMSQQTRHRAEERIAHSEREQAHLIDLLERATDFVARLDASGRVLHMNRGGRRMLGHKLDAPLAEHISSYLAPDRRALLDRETLPTAAREGVRFGESALIRADGSEVPVSQVTLAHKTVAGAIESFSLIARDITDEKRADQALRESEGRLAIELAATQRLQHISAQMIPEGRVEALYGEILDAAVAIMRADMATLQIVDKRADALRVVEFRGFDPEVFKVFGVIRPDTKSCCAFARRFGHRVIVPDVETCDFIVGTPAQADHRKAGIRAVQSTPLVSRSGELLGMISTHWRRPHEPQERDLRLLDVLARQATDLIERRRSEDALRESEARLRAMFGQAAVGIMLEDTHGRVLEANERMAQIIGSSVDVLRAMNCETLTHPEDWAKNKVLIEELVAGARTDFVLEKRYRRADGSWVWVRVTVAPMFGEHGRVYRLVVVVEDISARKLAELEVQRHREHLEQLVLERTAALEASHQRLRLADRLASIGTLAAGLGHDMGNLLLPVRMRIDALERMALAPQAAEDVRAIADACRYLTRLSQGLRLFALSPDDTSASGESTSLEAWWDDVAPFLRNAIPRMIQLESSLPRGLPSVTIAPHLLTQAVYNLVQNAGDAMKARGTGLVRISAALAPDRRTVVLEIADNGPGMSDEVARRCMEPFFTTKTRGISTGLGLALVRGAISNAGGSVNVQSHIGEGTIFRLTIPALAESAGRDATERARSAWVRLRNDHQRAYVRSILRSHEVEVVETPAGNGVRPVIAVVDATETAAADIEEFVRLDRCNRALVLGQNGRDLVMERVISIEEKPSAASLRAAISSLVNQEIGLTQEAAL